MPLNLKKFISCPMSDVLNRGRSSNKNKCEDPSRLSDDKDDFIGVDYNEDPDLILMRKTIEKNPEIFILNNLMMCVQFFKNFDEEISQIRETLVSPQETQLNANLLPQKRVLIPDVLQEYVGKNLRFTSARQTLRPTVEPLQPIRLYIVHENFEIAEQNDPHHYTTMSDVVTYNLWLKPSDHKGYVYLQHLGAIQGKRRHTEEELRSIEEKSDEMYEECLYSEKADEDLSVLLKTYSSQSLPETLSSSIEQKESRHSFYHSAKDVKLESLYFEKTTNLKQSFLDARKHLAVAKQRMTSESPASSTSSGYITSGIDSDSDYGYSGNSSVNDLSKTIKNAELPKSCFKMITYTQSGKIYDPREERRQNLTSKQKRIKDELRRYNYNVWYIHNVNFMRHFFKLFKQQLAEVLALDEAAVDDAKCFGCVIYCDKIDVFGSSSYTKVEPYEIVPSLWFQWPECAHEWLERERGPWPDFGVIEKIKEFGCYMVPEGFTPKQEGNPLKKIEWQLTFPAAERYLETCMNHVQTKVLLVAMMLHKTFVRPVDTLLGLSTSHIRSKLFWLIEQTGTVNWAEHRTGECLIKLLTTIYQSISQNPPLLKDYFLKDKNLFQNIPNECLLQSQKQINRILTNPVMYLIYAMENIHHKQSFFPKVDFDELLQILTLDLVSLVNPQLVYNERKLFPKMESTKFSCNSSGYYDDATKNSDYITIPQKPVTNKTLINSTMKNPIIEISVRCAEMEDTRLCILMDFFIRHFIQTAQRYHQYGAWKQKASYIAQAERLCILLAERDNSQGNARVYLQKINVLKNMVIKMQSSNEVPETPKRNSDKPVYSRPLNERFSATAEETEHKKVIKISEVPQYDDACTSHSTETNHLDDVLNSTKHEISSTFIQLTRKNKTTELSTEINEISRV